MRAAYRGRAAAYAKMGELERALLDHDLVVLLYAVEVEILNDLNADRDQFLLEAAAAYRARGEILRTLGRSAAAGADARRADTLEAEAGALAKAALRNSGRLQLINAWNEPATLVIGGVAYRLAAGEEKLITLPAGPFNYVLQGSEQRGTGTLEAGQLFRLRVVGR
jgi:hypothetical protein